jgi:T-complex protein 1 subunit eta
VQVVIDKSDTEFVAAPLVLLTLALTHARKFRELLIKCASTSMSSKLIHSNKPFFSEMVVSAVLSLDPKLSYDTSLIGVKKVPGGGMEDSLLIKGVAFKKTFTYAGAEQQPKAFKNPIILCLNVELELKAEKDNAEVRIEEVREYQAIVDAEWEIIYRKLEAIHKTGAQVVLSKLPIGDLATQWFADRNIFCAGRVPQGDLRRVIEATGGSVQSTTSDILPEHLGTCESFEERQIGNERYNFFEGCPKAKTCTIVLRGGAEQFIEEVERSLNDAIQVVRRAVKSGEVVAGGGAMEVRPPHIFSLVHHILLTCAADGPERLHPERSAQSGRQAAADPDRRRARFGGHPAADRLQRGAGRDGRAEQAAPAARDGRRLGGRRRGFGRGGEG